MRYTIGLLPASGKPWHAGHDGLLRLALSENDEVYLFISTSNRIEKGEFPISGAVMEEIWKYFLEPTLPEEDRLHKVYGGAPVGHVLAKLKVTELELKKALAEQEQASTMQAQAANAAVSALSEILFRIYSDDVDIYENFPDDKLKTSAPTLFENGQIERRPVNRSETTDISGTKMRQFLQDEDKESFISFLPASVRSKGEEIYKILQDSAKIIDQKDAAAKKAAAALKSQSRSNRRRM